MGSAYYIIYIETWLLINWVREEKNGVSGYQQPTEADSLLPTKIVYP